MIPDAELVERSRRHDADAFGALVERHRQLVFAVALAACGDAALAEDVAQEAFVAAWRDLDRLRDTARVGTWIAGIARNLAANAVRTRARRDSLAPDATEASAPSPEDAARSREDRELLARALAEIPDAHRESLVLFYLEGESIAEIAAALGVREDVVKQRLSRGRRALKQSVIERVESALARTRIKPTFGAGVAAAIAISRAHKATAKGILVMTTPKLVGLAAIACAVAAGIWIEAHSHATPPAKPSARVPGHAERFADKAARDTLVAAIHDAHAKRIAASPPPPPSLPPESSPSSSDSSPPPSLGDDDDLDRAYIRSAMQELIPLLTECYQAGVDRDPKLAGTVAVDFTIEGEPGVGAVIGDSKIDPDPAQTTLGDPDVRECIQETMYALEIDPPAHGGVVHVHYPFAFSN
ncbi:MAG TPA: sigma-70 family RNA polymerase sigma factor [Kofleriaceae bacterium]|jgi:RNA polymerase sigma factor (sigma-70 family)